MTRLIKAQAAADRQMSTWHGAPAVTVVATTRNLPFSVPEGVRGVYMHRAQHVYVVASTQPAEQVADTLAHEIVAHFGLRKMMGRNGWTSFMSAVQSGARGSDWRLAEIRSQVRGVYGNDDGSYTLPPLLEADEMSAAIVEHHFRPELGRLRIKGAMGKRWAALKGHVNRDLMYRDQPASFDEVLGALLASEHRLRHGGPLFGTGWRLGRWYASTNMPRPWNPKAAPMSLRESENLLAAERDRMKGREDWKGMFLVFGLILCVAAFVLGIGSWIWTLFFGLGHFF